MKLAKNHVDIGLYTDNVEALLAFWQRDVGLPFEELLPLGGGARQHRHALNGSVFKLNASRDPLPADAEPAGYRELLIARPGVTAPQQLTDPDGNRVTLVPPGMGGVTGIGVRLAVRDASAFRDFYARCLELEIVAPDRYRCGDTLLIVYQEPNVRRTEAMRGRGYRYLTVQVFDVDAEHTDLIARGVEEGRAPVTLGNVARISFIRDPDGNWIEVSQRASLTGPLPPGN
jgi:catechol 2,3-dioxygenase-like lactoylglutathione lyase family enzyme